MEHLEHDQNLYQIVHLIRMEKVDPIRAERVRLSRQVEPKRLRLGVVLQKDCLKGLRLQLTINL